MFTRNLPRTLCSFLLLFTFAACSKNMQIQAPEINSANQAALEILKPWDNETAPGVAVAVMLDNEIVLSTGHGLANLEHDISINSETVFHAASVSKQFTAFATLLLASEGKLELDADIRKYLPEMHVRKHKISIRNLLNHTGGLREMFTLSSIAGWLEDDIRTNEQNMRLLSRQTGENFKPGEHVEYSNSGYFLLSKIVERVSKQSFYEFTQQRIFKPLGMSNTQFYTDRGSVLKNKAQSYINYNGNYRNSIFTSETSGSTGLKTTTLDLLKWARNFNSHTVGNDTVFKLMAERAIAADNEPSIFAKGQELRSYKGFQTWSHGGRNAGYRSFLLRIPEIDFAVSILSNRSDFDTAKVAFNLVDIFLGKHKQFNDIQEAEWTPATSELLHSYVGDYELFPGNIFSITTDGKLLYMSFNRSEKSALPQIGEHQFDLNPANNLFINFQVDDNGITQHLDYTIGIHGSIKAKRIKLEPFDSTVVNLSDFVGLYTSDELATQYELVVENQKLTAKHIRLPDAVLEPYQVDKFLSWAGIQDAEFLRNSSGEVVAMKVSGPLAVDIEFKKKD